MWAPCHPRRGAKTKGRPKAAYNSILMPAKDQAWPRATDPESTDLIGQRATIGRLRLMNRERRLRPVASRAKFGSDAVSAAGLAGAIGVQRVGGEDAHADQSEDTC